MTTTILPDTCSVRYLSNLTGIATYQLDDAVAVAKRWDASAIVAVTSSHQKLGPTMRRHGFKAVAWFTGRGGTRLTQWVRNLKPRQPKPVKK